METIDGETLPQLSDVIYCSPSLAINAQGLPGVSYLRKDYQGSGNYNDTLKYAVANGSSWDIQMIDSTDGLGLYFPSLRFDGQDNPLVGYEKEQVDINPPYEGYAYVCLAQKSGNGWRIETVQGGSNLGLDPQVADFGGLAINNSGAPCLSINQACTMKYLFRLRSNNFSITSMIPLLLQ